MPSVLVDALRAEHTTAIRFLDATGLFRIVRKFSLGSHDPSRTAYFMTSSTMVSANFPTLVPPNFCTIHLVSGGGVVIVGWKPLVSAVSIVRSRVEDAPGQW